MFKKLLGWLLYNANCDPFPDKENFYRLKTRLLLKYAVKVGQDIQHIKKTCRSCDGGVFKCNWKLPETCWNCMGTGIYDEFYSRLDKYKLAGYSFHNPVEKMARYYPLFEGKALPMIEGFINHEQPKYRLDRECLLWLFLIFDRKLFFKTFGQLGHPTNKRTPLVFIENLVFNQFGLRPLIHWTRIRKHPLVTYHYMRAGMTYCQDDDLPF